MTRQHRDALLLVDAQNHVRIGAQIKINCGVGPSPSPAFHKLVVPAYWIVGLITFEIPGHLSVYTKLYKFNSTDSLSNGCFDSGPGQVS